MSVALPPANGLNSVFLPLAYPVEMEKCHLDLIAFDGTSGRPYLTERREKLQGQKVVRPWSVISVELMLPSGKRVELTLKCAAGSEDPIRNFVSRALQSNLSQYEIDYLQLNADDLKARLNLLEMLENVPPICQQPHLNTLRWSDSASEGPIALEYLEVKEFSENLPLRDESLLPKDFPMQEFNPDKVGKKLKSCLRNFKIKRSPSE